MIDNVMIGISFLGVLTAGIIVGAIIQFNIQGGNGVTDYDQICVNAGYHRAVEIQGDWHCATPIYGFNGVLMNSKDPTP